MSPVPERRTSRLGGTVFFYLPPIHGSSLFPAARPFRLGRGRCSRSAFRRSECRAEVDQSGQSRTFESGNPPRGDARIPFSVRFYLVAMLFLIFDLEVVFLYPWAILFRQLGLFGLIEMGIFLGIL